MNCFACIMVCVGVSAEQFSLGSINQSINMKYILTRENINKPKLILNPSYLGIYLPFFKLVKISCVNPTAGVNSRV
jgi:hypothetical protein